MNNEHYIVFKSGIEIFMVFDTFKMKESTSLFDHDFFIFELGDKVVSCIESKLIESIFHYDQISDNVKDIKSYDYNCCKPLVNIDDLPFPDVEFRYKVYNDDSIHEFDKLHDACQYAEDNSCAVFDSVNCNIIVDYRFQGA